MNSSKEGLKSALNKIKKCLALAKSANEHEAAAALRQAQKLMAHYGLTQADSVLSEVTEAKTRSRGIKRPAQWEGDLAAVCANGTPSKGRFARNKRIRRDVAHAYHALHRKLQYAFDAAKKSPNSRLDPFTLTTRCSLSKPCHVGQRHE